jgi:hypothetical protein
METLAAHDITEVVIEFDGGGDEGQVDDITCTCAEDGRQDDLNWPCGIPDEGRSRCTALDW